MARQLFAQAYDRWNEPDTAVASYTALVRQRLAASLRTPPRDRLVYSNEHAVRTHWWRGGRPVVVVLGNRTRHPGRELLVDLGEAHELDAMSYAEPFVPGNDPLFFNWDREQEIGPGGSGGQSLVNPLAAGSDLVCRFRSGDTTTVSFPDGRRIRAVELLVTPLRCLIPGDLTLLEFSPHLPPPIWEEAEGFASREEREDDRHTLANVPVPSYSMNPWALRYGWGSPEMVR